MDAHRAEAVVPLRGMARDGQGPQRWEEVGRVLSSHLTGLQAAASRPTSENGLCCLNAPGCGTWSRSRRKRVPAASQVSWIRAGARRGWLRVKVTPPRNTCQAAVSSAGARGPQRRGPGDSRKDTAAAHQ